MADSSWSSLFHRFISGWKYGFCDCFGSCDDCVCGFFCPCIHACQASKAAEQGNIMSILNCLFYPFLVPFTRNNARVQHGIDGNLFKDFFAGCCL